MLVVHKKLILTQHACTMPNISIPDEQIFYFFNIKVQNIDLDYLQLVPVVS